MGQASEVEEQHRGPLTGRKVVHGGPDDFGELALFSDFVWAGIRMKQLSGRLAAEEHFSRRGAPPAVTQPSSADVQSDADQPGAEPRSEERRVGKGGGRQET